MEDLSHGGGLRQINHILRRRAIELLALIAIAVRGATEHIDPTMARTMQLATAVTLHELRPLVFGDHALHL